MENKGITFLEFLDIHYMHGSPMDDDYERDMQLPFKKMNHLVNMTPVHLKAQASIVTAVILPSKHTEFFIPNDHRVHSKYPSAVFQPPKV